MELRRRSVACLANGEGATADEIRLRFQRTGRWDAFPDSETSAHLRFRVRRAMETIAATNPERRIAVVCHGGVINAYLAEILGVERDMFFFPRHTSVNVVRTLGDSWSVDRINDVLHLQSSADDGDPLPSLASRG